MKILLLVAFAAAIANAAALCTFDAVAACDRCQWDRNWLQYVADDCNGNTYYLCEKVNGAIIPHRQQCNPCFWFSNENWACSIQVSNVNCAPPKPPPVVYPIPKSGPAAKNFFCLDFDHDQRERVYYDVDQSCQYVPVVKAYSSGDPSQTGLSTGGFGLYSNGAPCNVEIPFFQNNQFKQFTMCGFFNWFNDSGSNGEMGLLYNGDSGDCYPGSIRVLLTEDHHVKAAVINAFSNWQITHSRQVSPWVYHKVCVRYDGIGKTLSLTVDDVTEKIKNYALSGFTNAEKCNMRMGQVLERTWSGYDSYYFNGILDSWCFSPSIVDERFFL